MTSKEALECIIYRLTAQEDDLELRETAKVEIAIIKKDLERLEELTKTPTEEEVLKEFEELGYEILISPTNNNHIQIAHEEKDTIIEVCHHKTKTYWYECRCFGVNQPQVILPNEHQLLTKLFKAWGY